MPLVDLYLLCSNYVPLVFDLFAWGNSDTWIFIKMIDKYICLPGCFNSMFNFSGSWQLYAATTKSLAMVGCTVYHPILLFSIKLVKEELSLCNEIKRVVPYFWDPVSLARWSILQATFTDWYCLSSVSYVCITYIWCFHYKNVVKIWFCTDFIEYGKAIIFQLWKPLNG